MPGQNQGNRPNSNQRGYKGNWRGNRGGYASKYAKRQKESQGYSQTMVGAPAVFDKKQQIQNVNVNTLKSANPLNQYYLDLFIKLKKDTDLKNLRNQSFCYKRVIYALSKYPMPILCAQQCQLLEGVGDTVAHKFTQMIQDREKEYEDGLFFGGLAHDQKKKRQAVNSKRIKKLEAGEKFDFEDLNEDYNFDKNKNDMDHDNVLRNFAGINMNDQIQPDVLNMSLKQFLITQDKVNFRNNFGQLEKFSINKSSSQKKKRGRPAGGEHDEGELGSDQEMEDEENGGKNSNQSKKLKNSESEFLDIGSVSWSMLIALYFLTLHDDCKDACITFDSIHEMLDVLKQEFGDMLPLESNLEKLIQEGPYELQKFREHCFFELIDNTVKDHFQWRMVMTQKGIKRAKGLCKSVGLIVNLEVDLNDKARNKITINMYDRHLMPIVEDLYFTDQTQQVRSMKQETGGQASLIDGVMDQGSGSDGLQTPYNEKQMSFFANYITQIESEIMDCMGETNPVQGGDPNYDQEDLRESGKMVGGQNKKLQYKTENEKLAQMKDDISIMADIFQDTKQNDDDMEDEQTNKKQALYDILNDNADKDNMNTLHGLSQIPEPLENKAMSKSKMGSSITMRPKLLTQNYDAYNAEAEVILFVDNREKRSNADINYFFDRFKASGLKTELKTLPLGDFLWVIRLQNEQGYEDAVDPDPVEEVANPNPDEQDENATKKKKKKKQGAQASSKVKKQKKVPVFVDYVLDFIIERKTADDLAASIMDGRYEEQKFRLKNCGINNVIYLVEGTPGQYCKIPEAVLRKASIHTQIFHGFNLMRIPTIQESLKWLTHMTKEMQYRMSMTKQQMGQDFDQRIKDTLIDFKQFQNESSKNANMNVQQIFARQLRAVKGFGIDNCSAMTRIFKTPRLLHICYEKCTESDVHKENLLNAGKLELMKNQVAYKDQVNGAASQGDFCIQDFIPAAELGQPDLPRNIEDVDKINLFNVISSATPKFFNRLHKEFQDNQGITVRKVNKTQCTNMRKLFCQRKRYVS